MNPNKTTERRDVKMRNMTKFAVMTVIAGSLICAKPALAAKDVPGEPAKVQVVNSVVTKQMDAEETVWSYRINNGILEKRLWSVTNLRWLTDWMPA
jgi:hypothetical protein